MPDRLELALTDLAGAIAFPAPSPAFASRVTARLETAPAPAESALARWRRWASAPAGGRPLRRSLVIAVALLLVAATVAAAIGLGLPGIRILFGPPASPGASAPGPSGSPGAGAPLGSTLGIGAAVPLAEAAALVGFEPRLPAEGLGQPEATFVSAGRLTLVWAARPHLPEIEGARAIGLLVTELRGTVDSGSIEKQVHEGATVTDVRVDGEPGFWIEGPPHSLVYRQPNGNYVQESRRMVGDVLIWRDEELTLRLETSLGLEEAIRIAESIR